MCKGGLNPILFGVRLVFEHICFMSECGLKFIGNNMYGVVLCSKGCSPYQNIFFHKYFIFHTFNVSKGYKSFAMSPY